MAYIHKHTDDLEGSGNKSPKRLVTRPLFSADIRTALLLALCTIVNAHAIQAQSSWSWQVINYDGDLWISGLYNGSYQFQYRIEASGSIQEMRYCPAGYIDLLAQETPGEPFNQTDAVDQAVLWVQALKQDGIPGVSTLCWNVNSGLWRPIGLESSLFSLLLFLFEVCVEVFLHIEQVDVHAFATLQSIFVPVFRSS